MMKAIYGSCSNPPVVVPYLQYYFPEIVEQVTSFSRDDYVDGELEVRVEARSQLHDYFDCDWARVTVDRERAQERFGGETLRRPSGDPVTAEELLDAGLYEVASEVTRRFHDDRFVYGRVGIPYGALFADWSDIAGSLIALHRDPDWCKQVMEDALPQRLEEIKAWAEVGVDGLWLGQWMCSADILSEEDYLEFIHPLDQIMIDAVESAGMASIYHFCGDAIPRLKHIKTSEPTVFGVEESKKGFEVDIGDVREEMGPDVCLMGNVDVYHVVEMGTPEEWAEEVRRQISVAGPEKFIVSCGSPITHDTPPEQVREYVAVAKEVRDSF
jgi:hypothetical protein